MYDQNFQQYYYSANCYESYFSNVTAVMSDVLSPLSVENRNQIYYDTRYGMNSSRALTVWIAAYMEGI